MDLIAAWIVAGALAFLIGVVVAAKLFGRPPPRAAPHEDFRPAPGAAATPPGEGGETAGSGGRRDDDLERMAGSTPGDREQLENYSVDMPEPGPGEPGYEAMQLGRRVSEAMRRLSETTDRAERRALLEEYRQLREEYDARGRPASTRSGRAGGTKAGPAASLPALDPREYRVWFGTNRAPIDRDDLAKGFSGARDSTTRYGHCDVLVPESHKVGSIGSTWWRRLAAGDDDRLRLSRTGGLDRASYWRAIAGRLAALPKGKRHALVFIHGFNVSFDEAAIRAAQIGFDLGIEGATAFFSWPSRGTMGDYPADAASIEASELAIARFLADFGRRTQADQVHVIAHSMGNRGLLRAMQWILGEALDRGDCRFGQFILAAPDIDADTFRNLAGSYRAMTAGTTLYVSARDRALGLSRWLHDYPRVGFEPPISIFPSIDTISVTNIDLTMLGHGYVAAARPVLTDMHQLIFSGAPPGERGFLEERKDVQGRLYWAIRA